MSNPKRFPFIERRNSKGGANAFPCVPIALIYGDRTSEIFGLLDTGSSLNVLPYDVGLEFGSVCEEQSLSIPLSGNLAPWKQEAWLLWDKFATKADLWSSVKSSAAQPF